MIFCVENDQTKSKKFKLGSGAGLVGASQQNEFKYMKKADLIAKDKGLAKLFQDTESGKAPYKLPFRAVDGVYNGCAKCTVAGLPSHGGTIGSTGGGTTTTSSATTAAASTTSSATTAAATTTSGDEYYDDEYYDDYY